MDTSWSAAPEISCVAGTRLRRADPGKLAALAGKRHFAPARAGLDPVRWSRLNAGARLRCGLAGQPTPDPNRCSGIVLTDYP
jgi:hypothetical protein